MDSTGAKGIVWATIGTELIGVAYDLRYMIMASIVLILTDFWWGYADSKRRYSEAEEEGDKVLMERYKWHKSRAGRRSANKIVDYLTYLLVGAFLGLAILEPMDICGHVVSAAIALGIGCACELASIIGHIFYVKLGIEVKLIDVWRMIVRFFVNLVKIKNEAIGEAVSNTIEHKDDDNNGSADKAHHAEGQE